jgi:predicted outer membrane repeat protein
MTGTNISGSTFTNNQAENGGAISNEFKMTITSSTFTANQAGISGSRVYGQRVDEHHRQHL